MQLLLVSFLLPCLAPPFIMASQTVRPTNAPRVNRDGDEPNHGLRHTAAPVMPIAKISVPTPVWTASPTVIPVKPNNPPRTPGYTTKPRGRIPVTPAPTPAPASAPTPAPTPAPTKAKPARIAVSSDGTLCVVDNNGNLDFTTIQGGSSADFTRLVTGGVHDVAVASRTEFYYVGTNSNLYALVGNNFEQLVDTNAGAYVSMVAYVATNGDGVAYVDTSGGVHYSDSGYGQNQAFSTLTQITSALRVALSSDYLYFIDANSYGPYDLPVYFLSLSKLSAAPTFADAYYGVEISASSDGTVVQSRTNYRGMYRLSEPPMQNKPWDFLMYIPSNDVEVAVQNKNIGYYIDINLSLVGFTTDF
jgi:hypothetical protein